MRYGNIFFRLLNYLLCIQETRGECSVGPAGAQAPTEKKNYLFLFKRKINKSLNNPCQIIK